MFEEQRPWNGARMEQRQLIVEQQQWSKHGMEQRLKNILGDEGATGWKSCQAS